MQNKKSLLHRLLVIYITFFIVLAVSIAHSIVPNFSKGYNEGTQLGDDIVKNWVLGTPRLIYTLQDIPVFDKKELELKNSHTLDGTTVKASVKNINLIVETQTMETSPLGLAFSTLGGSPWIYLLIVLGSLSYAAIIVFMFIIIHSLRRSIRKESTLSKRNTWHLRIIGALVIFSELCHSVTTWWMNSQAAELLNDTGLVVDSSFPIAYGTIIMGIIILFAAEVFAIGQELSEEQKLTI